MEYIYTNKLTSLNLEQIHSEVNGSTMEDKSIEYCIWHEEATDGHEAGCLHIVFTNELSGSDKTKLDLIIEGI